MKGKICVGRFCFGVTEIPPTPLPRIRAIDLGKPRKIGDRRISRDYSIAFFRGPPLGLCELEIVIACHSSRIRLTLYTCDRQNSGAALGRALSRRIYITTFLARGDSFLSAGNANAARRRRGASRRREKPDSSAAEPPKARAATQVLSSPSSSSLSSSSQIRAFFMDDGARPVRRFSRGERERKKKKERPRQGERARREFGDERHSGEFFCLSLVRHSIKFRSLLPVVKYISVFPLIVVLFLIRRSLPAGRRVGYGRANRRYIRSFGAVRRKILRILVRISHVFRKNNFNSLSV